MGVAVRPELFLSTATASRLGKLTLLDIAQRSEIVSKALGFAISLAVRTFAIRPAQFMSLTLPAALQRTRRWIKSRHGAKTVAAEFSRVGAKNLALLLSIAEAPTAEEIEDVRMLDAWIARRSDIDPKKPDPIAVPIVPSLRKYAAKAERFFKALDLPPPPPPRPIFRPKVPKRVIFPRVPRTDAEVTKFFEDRLDEEPFFETNFAWRPITDVVLIRHSLYSNLFSIPLLTPWSEARVWIQNHNTMYDTLRNPASHALAYPFPSPRANFNRYFLTYLAKKPEFKNFINSQVRQSGEDAKTVVTLLVLTNYEAAAKAIERDLKRKAKKRKKKGIIKTVASVALAGMMSLFAPAIIASTLSTFRGALDLTNKIKVAKGMMKGAKLFAKHDSAFSQELTRVAQSFDVPTALDEEAAQPKGIEEKAIEEEEKAVPVIVEGEKITTEETEQEAVETGLENSSEGERIITQPPDEPPKLAVNRGVRVLEIPVDLAPKVLESTPEQINEVLGPPKKPFPVLPVLGIGVAAAAGVGTILLLSDEDVESHS